MAIGTAVSAHEHVGGRSLATWWRSRYGAQLLVEIGICGGLLAIYRAIRTVNRTDLQAAFANARDIVRLEQWLGLPFEDDLQRFLLDHPTLIKLLNHYYIWFHFPAAIALLLWLYFRHADRYVPIRNLMAFATFAALLIHLLFPLAPPRMMSGFVDTMREFGPNIYPKNALDGAANQIAAMPSLHFGWAMIEAMAVISVLKSRWRWLILILGAIAGWRVLRAWAGDRHWSWTKMRFQAADGIDRLESMANGGQSSGEPSKVSIDANDDTGERRSFVG